MAGRVTAINVHFDRDEDVPVNLHELDDDSRYVIGFHEPGYSYQSPVDLYVTLDQAEAIAVQLIEQVRAERSRINLADWPTIEGVDWPTIPAVQDAHGQRIRSLSGELAAEMAASALAAPGDKVVDLMTALEASVARSKADRQPVIRHEREAEVMCLHGGAVPFGGHCFSTKDGAHPECLAALLMTCSGVAYPVNADDPTEGYDVHHTEPCPVHPEVTA